MNILPKHILKGTNSNGSTFSVNEWDYSTLANLQGVGFFVALIISLLLCSVASPIILILCVVIYNGKTNILSLIGALISTYFLIDCYNDWLAIKALGLFCDESEIKLFIAFNIASLITHLLMMANRTNKKMFYFIIIMTFLGGFIVGTEMSSDIGKLRFQAFERYEAPSKQNQ